MKKNIQLHAVLISGIVLFLINGCSKDGATGPQGPIGKDGKTNVITANFTMGSWLYKSPYYYENLYVPELTTQNIDSALVMVYFSTISSNWLALPYTQYNSPSDYYMGFVTSSDTVQVTWVYDGSLSSGKDPNTYYQTTVKCKVVVIPPNERRAHPNVNHHDYAEVKAAYNLKD